MMFYICTNFRENNLNGFSDETDCLFDEQTHRQADGQTDNYGVLPGRERHNNETAKTLLRGFQHLPRDLANVNVLENNV